MSRVRLPEHFLRRFIIMIAGLYISALAVSFSLKAELGASPLSVCPAVYSPVLGLSVGTLTWVLCFIAIGVQIAVLNRRYNPWQLLQVPVALFYGYLTDFNIFLVSFLPAGNIVLRAVYCLLGILLLGSGIFITMRPNLLMLAPDAALKAIHTVYGWPFSRLKICMDCFLVASATAGSLLIYHRLYQVGVGTLVAMFLVGTWIGIVTKQGSLGRLLDKFMRMENID